MIHKLSISDRSFYKSRVLAPYVAILTAFLLVPMAEAEQQSYAKFNRQGELIRPEGWREWVYIGTPLTPNSLNQPEAAFRSGRLRPNAFYRHHRDSDCEVAVRTCYQT
jgi:hypothetical protein